VLFYPVELLPPTPLRQLFSLGALSVLRPLLLMAMVVMVIDLLKGGSLVVEVAIREEMVEP